MVVGVGREGVLVVRDAGEGGVTRRSDGRERRVRVPVRGASEERWVVSDTEWCR